MARARELMQIQRDLAIALSATPSLDEGLRLCLTAAIEAAESDGGGIYLRDLDSGVIRLAEHQGLSDAFVNTVARFTPETPHANLVASGEPQYIAHRELPRTITEMEEQLSALAVVPITAGGEVVACLNVASKSRDVFDQHQRSALETIAAQVGNAINRLQLEQKVQSSEDLYRQVLRNAHDAVLIHEFTPSGELGGVQECNDAACHLFGVSREELVRRPLISFVHPEEFDLIRDNAMTLVREGAVSFEARLVPGEGEARFVDIRAGLTRTNGRLIGISVFRDITERRAADRVLARTQKELKALAARLARNSEQERQYVATELHDGVIQALTGMRFALATAIRETSQPQDAKLREVASQTEQGLVAASEQLRNIIAGLRPPMLEHFGLIAAVRHLGESIAEQQGVVVDVTEGAGVESPSADVALAVFRIVQEALSNIAKHAQAGRVSIDLQMNDNQLTVCITDNGVGFDPEGATAIDGERSERLGLVTMSERASAVGGSLSIASKIGEGTQVCLTVPCG